MLNNNGNNYTQASIKMEYAKLKKAWRKWRAMFILAVQTHISSHLFSITIWSNRNFCITYYMFNS